MLQRSCQRHYRPMELNLEKVYFPCCLQTKKRYVGWSYESPDGLPKLDSKGIEVVRRDQCPIVCDVLREGLESLFITRDISKVGMKQRQASTSCNSTD